MDDLITWLKVQLDEDERDATAAFSGQADPENGWGESRTPGYAGVAITPHVGHIHEDVQAAHVVRWNPARALREVESKRAIIAWLEAKYGAPQEPGIGGALAAAMSDAEITKAFKVLVAPYSDRHGYREQWRP